MDKKRILKSLRKWYAFMALLAFIFLLHIIVSPLIWIWYGWTFAWKIALTGVVGMIVCAFMKDVLKRVMDEITN